ncbi:MAG: von Willebrand factor type domain protein, partial [Acidimicrobiales bacterium]|nr:von Willebrand factor type domain protein [Acidimicrobiales bacterium]
MRLSHHAHPDHRGPARLLQTERLRRDDRGYVLVTFALLLIPLLLIAGLAVDVGGWYSRTSDLQKATDAAALAGVVWLPNVGLARTYAQEAAKRNGYEDGVNGVTILVEAVGDRRIRVTITDPKVGSVFYQKLGGHTISLTRKA